LYAASITAASIQRFLTGYGLWHRVKFDMISRWDRGSCRLGKRENCLWNFLTLQHDKTCENSGHRTGPSREIFQRDDATLDAVVQTGGQQPYCAQGTQPHFERRAGTHFLCSLPLPQSKPSSEVIGGVGLERGRCTSRRQSGFPRSRESIMTTN